MSGWRFFLGSLLAALISVLLIGCRASALVRPAETSTPQPSPTPQPTATPAIVQPEAGITLAGIIEMDRAESARIVFTVSADGQEIERVSVMFTELTCESFSAGSSEIMVSASAAITHGAFEFTAPDIGDISGRFTSPATAEGTIHLAFYDGAAECGTWPWSAASD